MKEAGRITGESILLAAEAIRPGVTTKQLDTIIRRHIESQGAKPSFLGYGGFPGSACISINDQVIHGIPGPRVIDEGDIVKIDVGAFYKGFHGDSANTFPCGRISAEAQRLIDVTKESFWRGIAEAKPGNRVGDIGHAVQSYVEENGFSVVRRYVGHRSRRGASHGAGCSEFRYEGTRSTALRRNDPSRSSLWLTSVDRMSESFATSGRWSLRTGRCRLTTSIR